MLSWVFFLNWSITALQCCISFCCATEWMSNNWTHTPFLWSLPPTPPRPSRSSQSTELGVPALSVWHMVADKCQCQPLSLSHPAFRVGTSECNVEWQARRKKTFFHGVIHLFVEFLILVQWKSKENPAFSDEQHQIKIAEQLVTLQELTYFCCS